MAFPTTPLLDDFNRADGALGSNWSTPVESGEPGTPTIFSNAMVAPGSTDASAWWNPTTFGPDTEVFGTIPSASDKSAAIYLFARTASENSSGSDNYTVVFILQSNTIEVYRNINNVGTGPILSISHTHTVGSQYGMRVSTVGADNFIEVFKDGVSLGSTTDVGQAANVPGPGHIGAGLFGGGSSLTRAWDNFGGGTVVTFSGLPPVSKPMPFRLKMFRPGLTPFPLQFPSQDYQSVAPSVVGSPPRQPIVATRTNRARIVRRLSNRGQVTTMLRARSTPTVSDFPSTPIVETFTVADGPLPPQWTAPAIPGDGTPVVFSSRSASPASSFSSAYLAATNFAGAEVYATSTGSSGNQIGVLGRFNNPGASRNMYFCSLDPVNGVQLYRVYGGSATSLFTDPSTLEAVGRKLGLRIETVGSDYVISIYVDLADGNGWRRLVRYVETGGVASFPNLASGAIGYQMFGSGTTSASYALDDFGGGAYPYSSSVKQPLVTSRINRGRYLRRVANRGIVTTILRARSTTTATPLVKPAITVSRTSVRRRAQVVRARRRDPILLRAPSTPTAQYKVAQPIVHESRRSRLIRRQANKALILRAPFAAAVRNDRIRVPDQALIRKARAWRLRRRDPIIIRPPAAAPAATQPAKQPIVRITRRSLRLRLFANRAIVIKAPSTPTVQYVRPDRIKVSRQAVVRRARLRKLRSNAPIIVRPQIADQPTHNRIIVSREAQARRVKLIRRQANRPILLRAPVQPVVAVAPRQPLVRTTDRSRYLRRFANRALLLRAPSVTTATPLVRDTVYVTHEAQTRKARRLRLLANAAVILRQTRLGQAPQVQPAKQPLVRRDRRPFWFARSRNKPIILRGVSTPTVVVQPAKRQWVSHEAITRKVRVLRLRRHDPIVLRAPAPAAIPTSVKQITVHQNRRTAVVARLRHNNATIIRSNVAAPPPAHRITVPDQAIARKARVTRLQRNEPIVLRSPVAAPSAQKPKQPIVHCNRRTATVARLRRRDPIIIRSKLAIPTPTKPKQPIVHCTRKARYLRQQANRPIILRARSTPTATPLVRNRVIVNREALKRRSRWCRLGRATRIQPVIGRNPIGGSAILFTDVFDTPSPTNRTTSSPTMNTFRSSPTSNVTSNPDLDVLDTPEPVPV